MTASGGYDRGGVELIAVLARKRSEGGNNGLELGSGIVTGSEGSCGWFGTGAARTIGRGFGFSFGLRTGLAASSSSVMSTTSSVYCGDRLVALRLRILARSAMSGEKLLDSGSISVVAPFPTIESEWAMTMSRSLGSEVGV